MADGPTIDVIGLEKAIKAIVASGTAAVAESEDVVRIIARGVESAQKSDTPVDTGDLRRSIRIKDDTSKRRNTYESEVITGDGVEYESFVELGTRHIAARGFVRKSARGGAKRFRSLAKRKIGRAAERGR